mgnify:CR=1 FL=1
MSKFKVGDMVCRTAYSTGGLTKGCLYGVVRLDGDWITVVNDDGVSQSGANVNFELVVTEDQQQQHNPVSKPSHYNVADGIECVSDGGPSAYYDFHSGWSTWNDFADYKAAKQWKEHAFHLGNIGKVLCRWGDKSGTTKNYDARKVVYSGLRVLLMLEGKESVRTYLESLLEDGQFKELPDE